MTPALLPVLIVGGYGTFGGRLAELLAHEPKLRVIVAGRSRALAEAFCARLGSQSAVPLAFDRQTDPEGQLRRMRPGLVVDSSGPFQVYGTDPYALARACIALGIDYLDLADGADFVRGIAQFDEAARTRGVFVLSGVSSYPVLTAAAVRRLAKSVTRIETITAGIAPSPFARVGLNVIRAVASYAGKPIEVLRDGRAARGTALVEARSYTIAPPGRLPLRRTRFSLVNVPDLKLLPDLWPGLRSIWMGAGPVPEIFHRLLNLAALAVRANLVPSLTPLAPAMHWAMNHLVWGEHRSGMFVAVTGADNAGRPVARAWELLAEGDDGPYIPSMAAAAIIGRVLAGRPPAAGARAAVAELELADYETLFARRRIYAGEWQSLPVPADAPLYRRVLGEAWNTLPAPLQAMHGVVGELVAHGEAVVERGHGLLARLVATLVGFPRPGRNVPVRVSFQARDGREIWCRTFGTHAFTSVQAAGKEAFERLVCETFGPFTFGFALVARDDQLHLIIRRWTLLGLPMPRALAPRGEFYEFVVDGRFNFHVEIAHPLLGVIVRYCGWLVPASSIAGMQEPGAAQT
jgi:hypothetical protein